MEVLISNCNKYYVDWSEACKQCHNFSLKFYSAYQTTITIVKDSLKCISFIHKARKRSQVWNDSKSIHDLKFLATAQMKHLTNRNWWIWNFIGETVRSRIHCPTNFLKRSSTLLINFHFLRCRIIIEILVTDTVGISTTRKYPLQECISNCFR